MLFSPSKARAGDEDTQFWLTGSAGWGLAPHVNGTVEVSQRFRDNGDQLLTRAGADIALTPAISLGGALAYVEFPDGNEVRLHQQAILARGALSLRTRVEERFFAGADRPEIRLRQKVGVNWPAGRHATVSMAGELLYTAVDRSSAAFAHVDQWRVQASLQRQIGRHVQAGLGYLLIVSPRKGPDGVSHVPQLTLTLRL